MTHPRNPSTTHILRRSSSGWSLPAPVVASVALHVGLVVSLWSSLGPVGTPPGPKADLARMTWAPTLPPAPPAPAQEVPAPEVVAQANDTEPQLEPVAWPVESTTERPIEDPVEPTTAVAAHEAKAPGPFEGATGQLKPSHRLAAPEVDDTTPAAEQVIPVAVRSELTPVSARSAPPPATAATPPPAASPSASDITFAVPVDNEASRRRLRRFAERRGWDDGTRLVRIEVTISAEGRPLHARITRSSGKPALDAAAMKAVSSWTYNPAKHDGAAVRSKLTIPLRF